jgi:hypothetical protein
MEATRQLVRPALTANEMVHLLVLELEGGNLRQRHRLTGAYLPRYDGAGRDSLVSLCEARAALASDRHGIEFATFAPDTTPTLAADQAQQNETADEQPTNAETDSQMAPTAAIQAGPAAATAEQIKSAFPIKGGWGDKLSKAAGEKKYKWLDATWIHKGSRKPGDATTYSPVEIACALVCEKRKTINECGKAISEHFPEWLDEWNSKAESLQN